MEYGYGYLREPQVIRQEDQQSISKMDLTAVRRYLCPKSMGNPEKCKGCPGLKSCPAGQRGQVLINEEEHRQAMETRGPSTIKDREDFRAACESGYPRGWLIFKGYSEAAAQEKLVFWCKHYMDITREFGRERIMQKRKGYALPEKAQEPAENAPILAPEAPAEPVVEQQPSQRASGWNDERRAKYTEWREQQTREKIRAAMDSGDMLGYLISQGSSMENARLTIKRWQKKYPDLFEERMVETMTEFAQQINQEATQEKTRQGTEPTETDTISLDDFLQQMGFTDEPEAKQAQPETDSGRVRQAAELMRQEAETMERIAQLQETLATIRQQRRQLEKGVITCAG